jgi:integral membrane protein (TIGR00529 family)
MLNLIGVVIAFVIIVILIRKKFSIKFLENYKFGLSLILGSLIVGFFSLQTIGLIDIRNALLEATIYSFDKNEIYTETIELAILMTLIYILAKSMQETGAIKKLIDSLRTIFTKGGTIGVIPAIYGLMPVPGGALFSAPTIDEEGDKYNLDKNQKNFLNIWFRHIWFPIYPLSSAMIIITSEKFSNIGIYNLILADIPAFIAVILIGFLILNRITKNAPVKKIEAKKDYSGLIYLIPPLLPVILYVILQFFEISQIRIFIIGVALSIILVFYLTDKTKEEYFAILKNSLTLKLALAIIGIMIFREMFEVSKANMALNDIIAGSLIPAIAMVVIIPFILGVLTGYNLGAVALSYPILVPFFPADLNFVTLVGLTSLIFMSSLIGYLISPIHLCNVLSSDYLKTDTTRMYKMLIPAALSVLAIQIVVIEVVTYILNL